MAKKYRHPSWRVYRALRELEMNPKTFGLHDGVEIDYPQNFVDDLSAKLSKMLANPDYTDPDFPLRECLDLFTDIKSRQLLEGLLLSGKSISDISDLINASDNFIATYAALFYDVSVFRSHIDKMVYATEATIGEDRRVKEKIIIRGPEHFQASNRVTAPKLSIDSLLANSAALAYEKLLNYADDADSQELALGWCNALVKVSTVMSKKRSTQVSLKDFILELQGDTEPLPTLDDLK